MKFHRHVLRDVILLTLPVLAALAAVTYSTIRSFWLAEIRNFHGYPVRSLRVGSFKNMLVNAVAPFVHPLPSRYLPDWKLTPPASNDPRIFDLRIDGKHYDRLVKELPESGKEWVPAYLMEFRGPIESIDWDKIRSNDEVVERIDVDAHFRGQRMANYFFDFKAWKLKAKKDHFLDGERILNLTQFDERLDGHLTFLIADKIGLPAPKSRVVHLFVNKKDQGLYMQEEQPDETMIRRTMRMPGDVFYGELYVPDEPTSSSDEVFWNPYMWEKAALYNKVTEEHRPYLTALLDAICSESLESWQQMYDWLDLEEFTRHFAVLCFQGDQHVDHSHNHRMHFSCLSGKFEGLLWNPLLNMPRGHGVETMANRFFRKLCRDPRFLDRMQRVIYETLVQGGMTDVQIREIDRIQATYADRALDRKAFDRYVEQMRNKVAARGKTVEEFLRVAEAGFETKEVEGALQLSVHATAVASLRLNEIAFEGPAQSLALHEDRDFSGTLTAADRAVEASIQQNRIVLQDEVLLPVGRDFRAPYFEPSEEGTDSYLTHREYTRLASLETPFLIVAPGGQAPPAVKNLKVTRTVGEGAVKVQPGRPKGYASTESIHPWKFPALSPPVHHVIRGTVELTSDLFVEEHDTFSAEPGSTLLLGPGVSVLLNCKSEIRGLTLRRLDPKRPWGVFVILGAGANGTILEDCHFSGGSEDTLRYVYYSGMLSGHHVDQLVIRNCTLSDNTIGDDSIRLGKCHDLWIDGVQVDRAFGDGIDCDLCTGKISGTTVQNTRNDGIDLMTALVDISGSRLIHCGDKGISFGEGAKPKAWDLHIEGCNLGVGLKDGSEPQLKNVEFVGCKVAIAGYAKNWRYFAGGRGRFTRCTLKGNVVDIRLDKASYVILEDCVTEEKFKLLEGASSEQIQILTPSVQQ